MIQRIKIIIYQKKTFLFLICDIDTKAVKNLWNNEQNINMS